MQEDLELPQWFHLARQVARTQVQEEASLGASSSPSKRELLLKVPTIRPIDDAFLDNYFSKKLKLHQAPWMQPTNVLMKRTSEYIAIQAGPRLYRTIEDLANLDCARHTQNNRTYDKVQFHQGINRRIIKDVAPSRYNKKSKVNWLTNLGDGTRALRAVEAMPPWMVGNVYPPDISCWPTEPGIPIPFGYEDTVTVIRSIADSDNLCHELDIEAFRCITDVDIPILVHTFFPEPHSGFSGFFHFKMWIFFVSVWFESGLVVAAFNTDSCSTGIAASKILMTPSKQLIDDFGITYLGLPDPSYKYFSMYCQPYNPSLGFVPPPIDWLGEIAHHIRNFRKNLKNANKTLVFYSEQDISLEGTVEAGMWASMRYLQRLAEERSDLRHFGLKDMVTINSWFDQRNSAAEKLISLKVIQMLAREAPEDTVTPMTMMSLYFFAEPFLNPQFTHPLKIVSYVWRGLAVWEQQEIYVVKCLKARTKGNKNLHCPSYQFAETFRLMAHGVTNYVLKFHYHREDSGLKWEDDFRLTECNSNPLEGTNSELRVGGTVKKAGGTSITVRDAMVTMSRVQQVFDRKPVLAEAGLQLGAAKQLVKESQRKTLGLFEDNENEIKLGPHNISDIAESYDDFVQQVSAARRCGMEAGLSDYSRACPNVQEQCGEFWGEFLDKAVKRPQGMQLASGHISKLKVPEQCMDVSKLKLPKSVMKQMRDFEDQIAKEEKAQQEAEAAAEAAKEVMVQQAGATGEEVGDLVQAAAEEESAAMEENAAAGTEEEAAAAQEEAAVGAEEEAASAEEVVAGAEEDEAIAPDVSTTALAERYLNPTVKAILDKTRQDRLRLKTALENMQGNGGKIKMLTPQGELVNPLVVNGSHVRSSSGDLITISQACKVVQLRDYHSHDRGKRFQVYNMRQFKADMKEGHDICRGVVVLSLWGNRNDIFAVVRVLGIIVVEKGENRDVFSCKLDKQSKVHSFQVELLDPIGPVKQTGAQEFSGSGMQLPKLASNRIIKPVRLMPAEVDIGKTAHTALLPASEVHEMEDRGFKRVTRAEGYTHVQNLEEMVQDRDSGIMWNASHSQLACSFCLCSMYDEVTGVLVRCKICQDVYHQTCHTPPLQEGDFDRDYWECAVCSGQDLDFCKVCRKNWTDPLKQNCLLFCDGNCGHLYHQKCHVPPVVNVDSNARWLCQACELKESEEAAAEALALASSGATKRSGRVATQKKQKSGWTEGNAKGMNLGGPAGTNLQQATWDQAGSHGHKTTRKKKQKGNKKASTAPSAPQVGDHVEAKWKGSHYHYPGVVSSVGANGSYGITYEDGDCDGNVPPKNVRWPKL